jgi:ring-1,2-phenylacetyl-CoA epoxidase subunit PaaC
MSFNLFKYALHLADNSVIMGQRNAEWTGHGPVLEQDIAITNISLDLIGQARNFYQYAAELFNQMNESEKKDVENLLPRVWKTFDRQVEEDDLAYLRDENQFLNLQLVELPKGDWAYSILKQFFFAAFQFYQFKVLEQSSDQQMAAIAEKSLKETAYHLRWSGEWVIRLGDGTGESRYRIQNALSELWMFTGEMFQASDFESSLKEKNISVDPSTLKTQWDQKIKDVFNEAGLDIPVSTWNQSGGKQGIHTEYMGFLLAEMQVLQRTYPNSTW